MARKTGREARAERLTWFAMVLVFFVFSFDENITFPDYIPPFAIALILLVSGVYQYSRKWRVSPFTWIIFVLMLFTGGFAVYAERYTIPVLLSFFDPILAALLATVIVIGLGIVTNES
ncbi:MAG: hypothetical protein ACPG7F_10675 [Aggregatilineales bacterium]